ncbi:MaoC/PaaZ C-terminal domain-containing protein [Nocardia sp. NPDC019395]|uniref:MaoC/PaaZ C-terminal domain-containing protein n=1 Tax=Nocardia sp. NPDC019395 TaxID=3154686 RepID=UPI0033CC2EEA
MIVIDANDDLSRHTGAEAVSAWQPLSQQRVTDFADASDDRNPLHVDPGFARTTPYGSTIAHGYYFMATAPSLLETLWRLTGFSFAVAYGVDRIRFPSALPTGTRFRLRLKIIAIEQIPDGIQVRTDLTFEGEELERPVCVAESLYRAYR